MFTIGRITLTNLVHIAEVQQTFLAIIAGNIFDKLMRSTDQHIVKGSDYPDIILEMGLARIIRVPHGSKG